MEEAGWGKAPILLRIVIVTCVVSFVTLIIGYSTPLWFSHPGAIPINLYGLSGISKTIYVDHLGLWQACGGGHGCIGITVQIPAYLGATRAFESMGLIAMLFTLVFIVLFVWIPSFAGNNRIELAIIISSFVSCE
ncbi:hypothetical protein KUTeg_000245 [Tegillarca granosa]|uniref:Uncharacterized protein n=1 Tax=Tegillarca granosa TaxID=220873 RepID=A0ABQ9FX00_TEGGR|nr:hypothetical protein KUTeg_000245 [Tegillarca granosa]